MDVLISWATANPLFAAGIMAAMGLVGGIVVIRPHLGEVVQHNHPRC
jgi:hypothetical protein